MYLKMHLLDMLSSHYRSHIEYYKDIIIIIRVHVNNIGSVDIQPNVPYLLTSSIVSLKALDHHVISDQEIIENLHLSGKFRPRAKPFHRPLYQPVDKVGSASSTRKQSLLLLVCHCSLRTTPYRMN